jgi:hypothetical protein
MQANPNPDMAEHFEIPGLSFRRLRRLQLIPE